MEIEKKSGEQVPPPSKNQQQGCQKNLMHELLDFAALPTQGHQELWFSEPNLLQIFSLANTKKSVILQLDPQFKTTYFYVFNYFFKNGSNTPYRLNRRPFKVTCFPAEKSAEKPSTARYPVYLFFFSVICWKLIFSITSKPLCAKKRPLSLLLLHTQ